MIKSFSGSRFQLTVPNTNACGGNPEAKVERRTRAWVHRHDRGPLPDRLCRRWMLTGQAYCLDLVRTFGIRRGSDHGGRLEAGDDGERVARLIANQPGSLNAMSIQRTVAVVLIGAMLLSAGCTSMRRIRVATPAEPTYGQVQPGDTVMVQTPDGERWRFVVEQIDGETIIARGGTRFPREQVVQLWRRSFSGPKTIGLIAGIAGGVWVMIGIAMASAYGSLLSAEARERRGYSSSGRCASSEYRSRSTSLTGSRAEDGRLPCPRACERPSLRPDLSHALLQILAAARGASATGRGAARGAGHRVAGQEGTFCPSPACGGPPCFGPSCPREPGLMTPARSAAPEAPAARPRPHSACSCNQPASIAYGRVRAGPCHGCRGRGITRFADLRRPKSRVFLGCWGRRSRAGHTPKVNASVLVSRLAARGSLCAGNT